MRISAYGLCLGLLTGSAGMALAQKSATSTTANQPVPTLPTAARAFELAGPLFEKGDYTGAIREYLRVPSSDSAYVSVLGDLSLAYLRNKQFTEAAIVSRRAMELHQHSAQPYLVLADAEESLKNEAATLQAYADGLQRFPYNQPLYFNRGVSFDVLKRRPEALQSWQRSLELNPLHEATHYQLAWLALEQGQTARALISLLTYLALEPDAEGSLQVLSLAEKIAAGVMEVEDKDREKPFVPNQAFQELDLLLTSRVALRKEYTSKVKFDASIVKQAQLLVEKFPAGGPNETDLWLRAYGPLVEALRRDDNLTAFTYLILYSADDKRAAKWVDANKKKVAQMSEAVGSALLSLRARQQVAGQPAGTYRPGWYSDGHLMAIGEADNQSGTLANRRGPWLTIDGAGCVTEEGAYAADKPVGPWREYHANSRLQKEVNYNAEGKFDGRYVEYFNNGARTVEGTYQAGTIVGKVNKYHYCGALSGVEPYENGDINGEALYYYPDGKLQRRAGYRSDKLEGPSTFYYPDGTVETKFGYAADQRQGPFEVFSANGQLERKGSYEQGELHGDYQDFHPNGKPANVGRYDKGRQVGRWQAFYVSGKPSEEQNFDPATGELHGTYKDYDAQGRLSAELDYVQGRVVRMAYFDAAGKPLSQTKVAAKGSTSFKGQYPDGKLSVTGAYLDGKMNGEWRLFRRDGSLRVVRNYRQGQREGVEELYTSTGRLQQRSAYQAGALEGLYEQFFDHGQLKRTGFYQGGEQRGTWQDFYPTGQLSQEYNLDGENQHGYTRDYTPGGKITQERWLQYDRTRSIVSFDSTGKVIDRLSIEPDTKALTLRYPGGQPRIASGWLCYEYQGDEKWLLPNGKTGISTALYQGKREGPYRRYHPFTGQLTEQGQYRNGQPEGEWITYFPSGKVNIKATYRAGQREGELQTFFENGQPDRVAFYTNNELNGVLRIYNMAGEPVLEKVYENDELLGYRSPGAPADGALQPAAAISTSFANGKPAATETYQKGQLTGPRTYYYSSGQVYRRLENNADGQLHGTVVTYYPNGKLQEEEPYRFDELHGRARYFRPDGTLEREETYRCGEKAGPTVYYDAQGKKPLRTDHYWNTYLYGSR
ncbi:hypothetical protein [Hymenobacter terrestris]|uniref:Tetratricopeptide repeat protein n=1 Tax=Hymenobacter terrestris TaxID=2748310 RepID=A0ABX2PXX6_9BACT|nr:hypothetical protein [Hymenobacter terrestris]NVO83398.1 hypothetical protein [Hymenobacter terrestris]